MSDPHEVEAAIRTPDQRLRVFVSSTLTELADERAAVARAISALRLTPVLFEMGARPHPPREVYRAYLAQSDLFIGLYWQRYGWVGPGMEISGLEDEFRLSHSMPRLLYVKAPAPDREVGLSAMIEQLQTEATESYRTFRDAQELGRLVEDDLALLMSERFVARSRRADDAASPDGPRGARSIPTAPTSLLGREQDIAEVAKLLEAPDVRLVTLTGPGGIGKTRVAIAVGEQLEESSRDGVVFLSLASITESALVMPRIAAAVGATVEGSRPPLDAVVEHLGDAPMLLVLDNLEQVVDVAPELDELLARCRALQILATSRTVLRLRAEREYPVGALVVPTFTGRPELEYAASLPAVQLFVDRARAVRYGFSLTDDNVSAVVGICRRLDGVPLAIELAAARVRLLSPDALLARLEDSLDALGVGPVDLPERQRTLRATVEWSIGLLDESERDLLATLSVFVDGWTIDAATEVSGMSDDETLDVLDALAGHSLVIVDATDGGLRFRMLESVRDLASEHLATRADAAEVERRHAGYFGALVVSCSDQPGHGQEEWTERLRFDEGNIRRAISWQLAHDISPLPQVFRILWLEWQLRDRMPEGRGWIGELLERADELDDSAHVQVLLIAIVTAGDVGDDTAALDLGDRLEHMHGRIADRSLESAMQLAFAWSRTIRSDVEGALTAAHRAVEGFRQEDELGIVGYAPFITGSALLTAGMLEMILGRSDDARRHLTEVKAQGEQFGSVFLSSAARAQLASLAVTAGELEEARALLIEALEVRDPTELGTHPLTFCLLSFARLALEEGDARRAAVALGAADGLRERAGLRAWATLRGTEAALAERVEQELGGDRFDEARIEGSQLSRSEAVALVCGRS